ncbi:MULTISPECIES: LysM peptidoglycan-binding domain-containing protein [Streptomyces]|uniref:Autolysin n=1 Tax=Streptomyces chartreusis NRRL 3882 TaxID=1079985 RepID=A0A2N9B8Z2_STRCX|nr:MULTISPECIES: LysM peptidoglycan-binding domain-containing protein [Streptomyces]MYS94927.1 LysM peptidoglycan-binding domain-containing protein [Streptomyces sp. SID5464]SOR79813.1 autolysin [Streptomyces chartreusis NRRL 3882]
MPRGKHRRPRTSQITRRVVAAGTGGAALTLPLLGATHASAAEPAQSAESVSQAAQPAKSLTYTVTKGDTLYRIAEKYDVSGGWKQLYKDNRAAVGDNPKLIHPGLKLKVKTAKADAVKKTATKASAPAKPAAKPAGGVAQATQASAKTYANNLDGWIREALDIMAQKGIPGSYDGIYRNVMRESSGNPLAINNWDSNAAAGTPSKGLLQTIDPTFQAYHVDGTSWDPFDPVANITAACNYAAARYGSIDNVNGPY